MSTLSSSRLLGLPQELRDAIWHYVLFDTFTSTTSENCPRDVKRLTTRNNRWQWNALYPIKAPYAPYLALMRLDRQTYIDIRNILSDNLKRHSHHPPAQMTLLINYPTITPTWHSIRTPPSSIKTLEVLMKIDQLYHPAYVSRPPTNALHAAIFEILKQYIHYGPCFRRSSPLSGKLKLETVRITLAPPEPLEAMTYMYGFPAQQLEALYRDFRGYMVSFARSGIVGGDVGGFEVRVEGQREFERVAVTRDGVSEEDFVFFDSGGFKWEA